MGLYGDLGSTSTSNIGGIKIFKKSIERAVKANLRGDNLENALGFTAFLRANKMQFVRGKGYWQDKLYFLVKYKNDFVCFILIGAEYPGEAPDRWIIWADNSGSNCFEDFPLDERMKEIAWANVDTCGSCGYCGGGTRKTLFGKAFDRVCITPMSFLNPDAETMGFVKKMVAIRKNDILRRIL